MHFDLKHIAHPIIFIQNQNYFRKVTVEFYTLQSSRSLRMQYVSCLTNCTQDQCHNISTKTTWV